jgi:hypothetical protein
MQRTSELLLKSLTGLENEHPIQLELLIDEKMFQRLNENWLSPQQLLQSYDTERWHLSCELHLSQGLRLWNLSKDASVEALEPSVLRRKNLAEIEQMSALYRVKSVDT